MKDTSTRQQEFMRQLGNLCLKFGAEIEAVDAGREYECKPAIEVTMLSKWDDGELVEDFCQFQFESCNFMDAEA